MHDYHQRTGTGVSNLLEMHDRGQKGNWPDQLSGLLYADRETDMRSETYRKQQQLPLLL